MSDEDLVNSISSVLWVVALVLIFAVLFSVFGCSHKTTRVDAPAAGVEFDTSVAVKFSPGAVDTPRVTRPEPEIISYTVYFDYDRAELRADAVATLRRCLGAVGGKAVNVEGHCDERGSDAYNLGLGERRAVAVRDWLVENGVRRGDVTVVSYGRGRLARSGCLGDESCHGENRRVVITGRGEK